MEVNVHGDGNMNMLLDARDEIAKDMEVLHLDSGHFLSGVLKANQETGEIEYLMFDDNGEPKRDKEGLIRRYYKKANIVFVYKGE